MLPALLVCPWPKTASHFTLEFSQTDCNKWANFKGLFCCGVSKHLTTVTWVTRWCRFINCDTGVFLQSSDHSGVGVHTGRDDNNILSQMSILQLGKDIVKEHIQPGAERFTTAGKNLCSETLNFISHHADAAGLKTQTCRHQGQKILHLSLTLVSGNLRRLQPASRGQPRLSCLQWPSSQSTPTLSSAPSCTAGLVLSPVQPEA